MDFKNILIKLLAAWGVISLLYYWEIFEQFGSLVFHVYGALTVVVTIIGAVLLVLIVLNRKK